MLARSNSSSNGRDCAFVRNNTAKSVRLWRERPPWIFSMTNCASSRSLWHVTMRTGSPPPHPVKSVLPLRAMVFASPAGGAVVLPELHDGRAGKVLLEVQDVVDVGPAEAVDRLVLVTNGHDVAPPASEQLHELVLGVVRVLVLVDEQVLETLVKLFADVGMLFEQPDVLADEVVEIHGVEFAKALLVQPVNLGNAGSEEVGVVALIFDAPDQLILRAGDAVEDGGWGEGLVAHVELAHAASHQRELIGRVIDDERFRVS